MLVSRFKFLRSNFDFSWTAFAIFAPISIMAVPASLPQEQIAPSFFPAIIIGFLLTAACAAFMDLFLILKLPLWGALFALGLLRGFIFYSLFEIFEIENPSTLFARMLNSTSTTIIWLGLACIAVSTQRKFQRKYRSLVSQILISTASHKGEAVSTNQDVALLLHDLQRELKLIVEKGRLDNRSDADLARMVRVQISEALSPASEKLWLSSNAYNPKIGLSTFVLRALKTLKIPIPEFSLLFFVSSLFNLYSRLGPAYAITFATSSTLVAMLLLLIHERTRINSAWKNGLALLGIAGAAEFAGILAGQVFVRHISYVGGAVLSPVICFLLILVAAINQGLIQREEVLRNIAHLNTRDEVRATYVSETKAASFIHHTLQSELSAIAMQLDSDKANSQMAMERLEAFTKRSLSDEFENFYQSPEIKLEVIRNSWAGIADVTIDLDRAIHTDVTRAALVAQIIQEAIANSVRKGHANQVHVQGRISESAIHIDIVDNGRSVPTSRKGIGTAWLDRFAINDWQLVSEEGGTRLSVDL